MKTILQFARKLIAQGWCQRAMAMTADGSPVPASDVNAVSFCSLGAIRNAGNRLNTTAYAEDMAEEVIRRILFPGHSLISFNDTPGRTQKEVLDLFDRAILVGDGE